MNENVLMKWPSINKYFEQLESECQNNLLFKCLLCTPKVKKISTSKSSNSNLRTHIKLVHPNYLDNFNNSAKKRSNVTLNQCSKQLKIEEVGKISVKKLTQAEFDAANLQLIVCTVSPFSFIEHPAFLRYCKMTSNKVPVSRRTLMRNVQCIYDQMISQLINDLENIKYVCLTADCWSIFHRSYIGFTIHWIDPETLQRNSKGLACRRMIGRHTYDNTAEAIDKILNEFKIHKKTTLIVTDNAANFVKAFRMFNGNDDGIQENGESDELETPRSIEISDVLDNVNIEKTFNFSLPC